MVDKRDFWIDPDISHGTVRAWSKWHLPYTPTKTEHVQFASELRGYLRQLKPTGALVATYLTDDVILSSDLENVLFYNLKGGFGQLARDYVRFDRASMEANDAGWRNCAIYQLISSAPEAVSRTSPIATSSFECSSRTLRDIAELWFLFRRNLQIADSRYIAGQSFRVRVTISGAVRSGAASLMKKVLDAFLSALHFYEGPDLQEVVRRLAMKLNVEEKALAILLTDSSPALLGPKRSPALRGGGLQWSPDDHLLCEGEVVRKAANATQIVAALYGAA